MDTAVMLKAIQIAEILDDHPVQSQFPSQTNDIRIVILQRGFVFVGRFSQIGTTCTLSDGFNVRRWGTTKGLGEIAEGGPTKDTVLDPVASVSYHELSAVASIRCEAGKWKTQFSK